MVNALGTGSRRGQQWLKRGTARTLDLVARGEMASRPANGWLSNLHLRARNPFTGFVMLGKTFKGLTDELLAWQTAELRALEIQPRPPQVFVRPELVVESAFNDVQESPRYPGDLALRFARVKGYRLDKSASARCAARRAEHSPAACRGRRHGSRSRVATARVISKKPAANITRAPARLRPTDRMTTPTRPITSMSGDSPR